MMLVVLSILLAALHTCAGAGIATAITSSSFSRLLNGAGVVTWISNTASSYPVSSTPPMTSSSAVAPLTLGFNFSQAQQALMATNATTTLLGARVIISYTQSGTPSFPISRLSLTVNGTIIGADRGSTSSFSPGTGTLAFGGPSDVWGTSLRPSDCMQDGACGFELDLTSPANPRSLQLNITRINVTYWWTLDSAAVSTTAASTGTTGTTTGTTGTTGTAGSTSTTGSVTGTSSSASLLSSSSAAFTSSSSFTSSASLPPPSSDPIAASFSSSAWEGATALITLTIVSSVLCLFTTAALAVVLVRRRRQRRVASIGEIQLEMAKELGGSRNSLQRLAPTKPPAAGHVAPGTPFNSMQVWLTRSNSGFNLSVTPLPESSRSSIVGQRLTDSRGSKEVYTPEKASAAKLPSIAATDSSATADTSDPWDVPVTALKVQGEIGRGAYGIVFLGSWRCTPVAIKVLECNHATAEEKENFQAEMNLMKALRPHANVLQLLGTCKDPLCVITEYMPCGSLAHLLRSDEVIAQATKDKIILGIARGMLHLHMERIIHRDLAARNVLLTSSLEPKISDFGLSRSTVDDWTKTQSAVGPLRWMAPECIRKRVYGQKSDVWAFGITLIEIFTRRPPYPDLDHLQVASLVSTGELVHPLPAHAPVHYTTLMQRCFAYSPQQRPSFEQICDILARASEAP